MEIFENIVLGYIMPMLSVILHGKYTFDEGDSYPKGWLLVLGLVPFVNMITVACIVLYWVCVPIVIAFETLYDKVNLRKYIKKFKIWYGMEKDYERIEREERRERQERAARRAEAELWEQQFLANRYASAARYSAPNLMRQAAGPRSLVSSGQSSSGTSSVEPRASSAQPATSAELERPFEPGRFDFSKRAAKK